MTAPREGSVSLHNTPWLARMIDKARLEAEGTIADYELRYPCPMDQRLLAQLNIDSDSFQQIVVSKQSDDAIIAELQSRQCLAV